jgi:hypothetical protein
VIQHAVHIGFEIEVPDTKDLIAQRFEVLGSLEISFHCIGLRMSRAVEFNDELRGFAKKISDIGAARGLSPKLQPIQAAITQARPKAPLVLGLATAQNASISCQAIRHTKG